MPEYLAPGVYVEEIDAGTKPIEGVSTSTTGFVGLTVRGPDSGLPELVTSFAEFQRKFGGYFDFGAAFKNHNFLPYAVEGYFTNGGKRLYIVRVTGQNAAASKTTAQGGITTRLLTDAPIAQKKLTPTSVRGIEVGTKLQLRMIKDGVVTDSNVVQVTDINRASQEITVNNNLTAAPAGPTTFEARYTTVFTDAAGINAAGALQDLATPLDPRPNTLVINARDKGSWGDKIVIQTYPESAARAELDAFVSGGVDANKIRLKSSAGFYAGAWVEIDRGQAKLYRRVKSVDGSVLTLEGPAMNAASIAPQLAAPDNITIFSTCEFRLVATYQSVTEQYSGLTLENVPGRYYLDRINNSSSLLKVEAPLAALNPLLFPTGTNTGIQLGSGSDGANPPGDLDYKGSDNGPGKRTGIMAFEDVDEISIIAAPGLTSSTVQRALFEQCEKLMDRFAILDPENKPQTLQEIRNQRKQYDTKYAAIYYPRLTVLDPLTRTEISIPPSGHMAGIYARTDIQRGVHKAPANEVVRGISGLDLTINKSEQDILNPSPDNINVLRDFRADGRGFRVWGARCITSDTSWKYVNVRRLFIFLEESIDQGTQWAVFEPNDDRLWARIRQSVSNFLTRTWRDGALMGTNPEEAFFVVCDRTTMTQDDLENGRLIMIIGVAPVRPAEYVIIRIGQWAGGSAVQEL
ncbi:MAG: phage tail sheath C-terminal domain-containing protein [Chloroflexota bacterium]